MFEPVLDPDGALLDRVVQLERVKAAADAEQMILYAAMCTRAETWQDIHDPTFTDPVGPDDLVAAEIGPALHLAPRTAAIRVRRAVQIVTRLPQTLAAYRRGDLDLGRVLAIDDATNVLTAADAAKVEELVLGRAVDQTAAELRAALRKAVIRVDPHAAEKRRKQAIKDRSVTRYQDRDGTSVLRAVLSAVDTGEIYDLLDQVARRTKTDDDPRSMDARRADALPLLLLGREPHLGPQDDDTPPGPDRPGPDGPDHGPGPQQPPPPRLTPTPVITTRTTPITTSTTPTRITKTLMTLTSTTLQTRGSLTRDLATRSRTSRSTPRPSHPIPSRHRSTPAGGTPS